MHLFACLVVVTLVAAFGCAAPSVQGPGGQPTPTPGTTADTSGVTTDPQLSAAADLAVGDLARRLGQGESDIEVVRAERVTWSDGSLGCPQPGMMYTQALVNGYRVILGIDGRTRVFVYHSGPDGQPFLCPSDEPDGGHEFVPPPGIDI
jgi:hypothetical protein